MTAAIYNIISEEILMDMLKTFYNSIDLPIQVLDEEGNKLISFGNSSKYCTILKNYQKTDDFCSQQYVSAGLEAFKLGEAYIFSCHGSLNHIVFPLTCKGSFLGSVLVGPFLMSEPDSTIISDVVSRYTISTEDMLDMYDELSTIKVVEPARVSHVSRLLSYLFLNLVNDSMITLKENKQKLYQQSKINEAIQMYKEQSTAPASAYPYDKEKELISKVKEGDIQGARGVLNDLLGYVLFSEGSKPHSLALRAMELSSLLSRAAIEGGASADIILKINNQSLKELQTFNTIESLCYHLQETVTMFTDSVFNHLPDKNRELIKKAIAYITENYNTKLTLNEVSDYVHLNAAYFSTLFKQSTGSSFKEYLNTIRIEESKHLLSNTDISIIDIAIAVGYDNQSYFTKMFKRYMGITPKQFR